MLCHLCVVCVSGLVCCPAHVQMQIRTSGQFVIGTTLLSPSHLISPSQLNKCSSSTFLFKGRYSYSSRNWKHQHLEPFIKGTWQWGGFSGFFLQKLVPHRSLTQPFEPLRFWLWIRGDIRNWKTNPRLDESGTLWLGEPAFECLKENSASWSRLGELLTPLCRWFRFAQLAKGKKSRP